MGAVGWICSDFSGKYQFPEKRPKRSLICIACYCKRLLVFSLLERLDRTDWVRLILRGMAERQFRVEELNPFLEWHLHTSAASLEVASAEATRIAKVIGRTTRVLSPDGAVLFEVDVTTED